MRLTVEALQGLGDLAAFRRGLRLPEHAGAKSTTLARLDFGGTSTYGISGHGQRVDLTVNPISRTHAETDAFQQAKNAGLGGGKATLFIDHPGGFCGYCGRSGAVKSMARQLGITELIVVTPKGVVCPVPMRNGVFATLLFRDGPDGIEEWAPTGDWQAKLTAAIRSLDGDIRTSVGIQGPDGAEFGVGGSADGVTVYASFGEGQYQSVVNPSANSTMTSVVAGGQMADYPARYVVDVASAVQAASAFARDGILDPGLLWEPNN